jgi:arylsulfatase A-like enzyme
VRIRCLVLVFALAAAACGEPAPLQGAILVVFDTLRADRLQPYGAARPTSPHLSRLAEQGVLFEHAVSSAPWTLPAMVSLLSARVPARNAFAEGRLRHSAVDAFRGAGVATAAFTEGAYVSAHFGLDLGFDEYEEHPAAVRIPGQAKRGHGGIEVTFQRAGAWLRANGGRRFFLLVHTYEPHTPYRRLDFAKELRPGHLGLSFEVTDSERARRGELPLGPLELDYLRARYDGGVLHADAELGRLLALLDELGLAERVIVAVTSDHGEDLGERDPLRAGTHGHSLHEELVHIPLLIRDPRMRGGRRIDAPVRSVDVVPTLLEALGVEPPPHLDGHSLMPLLRGAEPRGEQPAFSMAARDGAEQVAVRAGRFKLMRRLAAPGGGGGGDVLYDLAADPGEREDVSARHRDEARRLAVLLDAFLADLAARGGLDLDPPADAPPDLTDQLRALGYVEDEKRER